MDAALDRLQARCEALLLGDVDDVFVDVEGRVGEFFHILAVGQDERPFKFEHQPAGGGQRDDVVALVDPGAHVARNFLGLGGNFFDVALFEEGHAAAAGIGDGGFDAVMRQHQTRSLADFRIVVVDEAGGEDRRLAAFRRRLFGRGKTLLVLLLRTHRECAPVKLRQLGAGVDAGHGFERRPRQLVAPLRAPVRNRRDGCCKFAIAIRLGKLTGDEGIGTLPFRFGRAVAQHQMREVEIEFMRRHVRTLRHEAHVAKRAGLDDGSEVLRLHFVEFARRALVDQVEEAGKLSQRLKQRRQP